MAVAAAMEATGIAKAAAADESRLVTGLKSQKRREQVKALLLIAPLFFFLLLVFVVPISMLLTKAVDNREVSGILRATAAALGGWDGVAQPSEAVYAALVTDFKQNPREEIAELAKRLNYYQAGLRSAVFKTSRAAAKLEAPPYREALTAIDPVWGEVKTWRVMRQALPALTDFYLLASLDLRKDEAGAITSATPDTAIYRDVLLRTFWVSASVTLVCLLFGYPLAYLIATSGPRTSAILLLLVLLPFWTSLLVRTTAWVVVLQSKGVINSLLAWANIIDPALPLQLIYNRAGVLIAMTHILLPFMVLPIYSVMKGISPVYMRAASSLGARPARAFIRVYLPLSLPGISAGALLVFILALGYYITPALVGGPRDQMVSYFIAYFTSNVINWGMAAGLSAILLILILVLILYFIYNRLVGIDRLRIG
jgi:putative spermidine/putrescine transport system permease protein